MAFSLLALTEINLKKFIVTRKTVKKERRVYDKNSNLASGVMICESS